MRTYTRYTPEMIEFLRNIPAEKTYDEIAQILKEKYGIVTNKVNVDSTIRRYKIWRNYASLKKPVGTIIVRYSGKNINYKYIKTEKGWKPYARYLWEQTYGTIPDGYDIFYRDGNTLNCDISNLIVLERKQTAIINLMYKPKTKEQRDLAIAITDVELTLKQYGEK